VGLCGEKGFEASQSEIRNPNSKSHPPGKKLAKIICLW
jgi:hypothetical protein